MYNNQQFPQQNHSVDYRVKLSDGRVVQIICNPFNLKKEILKQDQDMQSENILLVFSDTQNIVSAKDNLSMSKTQQQGIIAVEVRNANSLLKEIEVLKQQKIQQEYNQKNLENNISQKDEEIKVLNAKIQHNTQEYQNQICTGEQKLQILQKSHREEINNLKKDFEKQYSNLSQDGERIFQDAKFEIDQHKKKISQLEHNIEEQKNYFVLTEQENENQKSWFNKQFILEQQKSQEQLKQTIDQLNQNWITYHQEQISQLNKTYEAEQRYNNDLKREKNELEVMIHQLNTDKVNLEDQINSKQQKVDSLYSMLQKYNDIERETTENIIDSPIEQENNKLKRQVAELQQQLQSIQNMHENLKENIKLAEKKLSEEKKNQRTILEELISEKGKMDVENNNLVDININLSQQLTQLKNDIQECQITINSQKNLISNLEQNIQNLTNRIKEITIELNEQKQQVQQKEKTITKQQNDISAQNQEFNEIQHKLEEANIVITNQEIQIRKIQEELENSKMNEKHKDEQIRNLQTQINRSQDDIQYKDKVIKKMLLEQQDRHTDIIISPIEKLSKLTYGIKNFQEDPNSQRDNTEYDVWEITFDSSKAFDHLRTKQDGYFFLDECIGYKDWGSIKTVRSIQPNVDATFFKGYIIKIEEATNLGLLSKNLLRKELKLQNKYSKDEAAKLSMNNLMCKFLLDKFNQDLGQCRLNTQPVEIQRQFILKSKGNDEYIYCEMIKEGSYQKIELGEFDQQYPDVHQYINAFALYISYLMKQELIISNFQVLGKYLHDMIVSTKKFKFSTLDQGQIEIAKVTQKLEKMTKNKFQKYWNKDLEIIARKGF